MNYLQKNIRLYYVSNFTSHLQFILPVYLLFGTQYLGLSYTQAASFFLINNIAALIFDFFLGVVADTFSRKKSFIVGSILQVLSLLSFIFVRDYYFLLFMAFIGGIAYAFVSGTLDTLIYEQMVDDDKEKQYPQVTSKAQQMVFFGRASSSYLGGVLFSLSAVFPYIAYLVATVISAFSAGLIEEDKYQVHQTHMKETLKKARIFFLQRKDILYVCFVGLIFMLFSDMLFGYFQPYFTSIHIGSAFIGAIFSIVSLSSAYGSHLMKKALSQYTFKQINAFGILLSIFATMLLFVQNIFLVVISAIILGIAFGSVMPNLRHLLNKQSPIGINTSVVSFGNTFYSLGTTIGLFLAGFLADHFVPNTVLLIVLSGCIAALILNSWITVKQQIIDPTLLKHLPLGNSENRKYTS
jgi:MFS family permease